MQFGWNKKDFTLEKRSVRKELQDVGLNKFIVFHIGTWEIEQRFYH